MKHVSVVLTLTALVAGPVFTTVAMAQGGGGLTLTPTSLSFTATAGTATLRKSLTVSAGSQTRFTVSASGRSGDRTWLSVSPSGTLTTPQTLTVSANPSGLAAATYSGTISLTTTRGTRTVPVTLTVTSATLTLTVSPTSLSFSATTGGSSPPAQSIAVSASPNTSFTASRGTATWLTVSPASGTTPATLSVTANLTGLAAGTYNGTITVTGNGLSRTVAVTFTVNSSTAPTLTLSPTSLSFSATTGGSSPPSQSIAVSASPNTSFTASGGTATWLTVSSASGTTPATLSVTANLTGLAAGTYNGTITVTGNGLIRTAPVTFTVSPVTTSGGPFKVIGWNDLGMHCMDGKDYSVFAVLPPYNTIHAHIVDMSGSLVTAPAGFTVTYQAVTDPLTNTLNTTSVSKSNFWTYVGLLGFTSLVPVPDEGVSGYFMPGPLNTPQSMTFSSADNTWVAQGIPMLPFADTGLTNYFPMMRLTARNSSGTVLATTDIVLPTSDEMSCIFCHASNTGSAAAMPSLGWVNNSDPAKDTKFNILRKHDDRFKNTALFQSAATQVGYNPVGLEATVASTPILCYKCHSTNAFPLGGVAGVEALTTALHGLHANAIDPATGATLDSSTVRAACYNCHPGPVTQCLRGAMGSLKTSTGASAIECQNCHGNLSTLAVASRSGWLSEPGCQYCHVGTATNNAGGTLAFTSVFSSGTTLRTPGDTTFATTPNVPAAGFSLYRFSSGHGGLECEACHGSTHGEFPTPIVNDNVQSIALQGHEGMLSQCSTCHTTVPTTTTGGPHGLHPIGATWVSRHQDVAGSGGAAACQACHGTDYRGTVLSRSQSDQTLAGNSFPRGTIIGCYSCHNGPGGG